MNSTQAPIISTPSGLAWNASLQTQDQKMDQTHHEFIDMINDLLTLPSDQRLDAYRQLIDHTQMHFAQEERWMLALGFAQDNCHATHHAQIIETLLLVEKEYVNGQHHFLDQLIEALVEWFPSHAATMDAGLAQYMKKMGFNSQTETLSDPSIKIPAASMSGCGSVSCSNE